jgi:hypothetical protein
MKLNLMMVDTKGGGEYSCHTLVKSGGDRDMTICRRCREYEIQLGESLDKLSSVQMINQLLQKELLLYMTPKVTWGINIDSTDNNGDPAVNSEWTLGTTKNHMNK